MSNLNPRLEEIKARLMAAPKKKKLSFRFGAVVQLAPIDLWFGWSRLEDFLDNVGDWDGPIDIDASLNNFTVNLAKAFEEARRAGWEGDIREGPYVAPIMNDMDDVIVAWKQDNNGTTFVAAPSLRDMPLAYVRDALDIVEYR
jgi:hypothetical protein